MCTDKIVNMDEIYQAVITAVSESKKAFLDVGLQD